MHPDAAVWQAFIDDELPSPTRAELRRHREGCALCSRSFAELERASSQVKAWLDLLESRPPLRSAEAIRRRSRSRALHARSLAAASILLTIATFAGATIHSGALDRLLGNRAPDRGATHPNRNATSTQAESPVGIAVHPGSALEVRFEGRQREGSIRIAFADQPTVAIVASSSVSYTVERDRVTISNREASASYTITLPRALSPVLVKVGEEVVFSKRDGSIITESAADQMGGYVLPLSRADTLSR